VVIGDQSIEENKTYLLILIDVRLLISVEDTKEKGIGEVA
jgi:hypothetical protein